jgi:hypothetical protein
MNENRADRFFMIMYKQISHELKYNLNTQRVIYGKLLRPIA